MFVHNVRYGFATNSSSTHSIVLINKGERILDDDDSQEYGWEFFTCASETSKRQYLGQTAKHCLARVHHLPNIDAAIIASAWAGVEVDPEGYIDHQSLITIPTSKKWNDSVVSRDFFNDLLAFVLRDDVAIVGGNDNEDHRHPIIEGGRAKPITQYWSDDEIDSPVLNLMRENDSEYLRGRYDATGKFWSLFSTRNGTKIRTSFVEGANADKSEVPELVDIKITDYCKKGCYYCVAPNTKVLTKDLVWIEISKLDIGQEIVAFDEVATIDDSRKLRIATITDKWITNKPAIKVTTEHGEIVVSEDHRFLCGDWRWRRASYLRIGSRILSCQMWDDVDINNSYWVGYLQGMTAGDGTGKLLPTPEQRQIWWRIALSNTDGLEAIIKALDVLQVPHNGIKPFDGGSTLTKKQMYKVELRSVESIDLIRNILARNLGDRSFKAGWLAGFYDAEGSLDKNSGVIRIYQVQNNENPKILSEFLAYFGFDSVIEDNAIRLRGGRFAVLRFFGIIRPKILDKVRLFNGEGVNYTSSKVVKLEQLDGQELIDITTTTKTFLANGMAVHNCYQGSTPKGKHADKELIRGLAYALRDLRTFEVALGGGEPTEHPDLLEIIDDFHHMGLVVNLTTRNEDWIVNNLPTIKDKIGAIGFSVDSSQGLLDKLSRLKASIPNLNCDLGIKLTVQVVVGSCSESELKYIFEICRTFHITVLLLGWKNTHRGAKGSRYEEINLEGLLNSFCGTPEENYTPWKGPNVSFDTTLVNQMKDWLDAHADKWRFTTREGAHSMYIDCVKETMHKSSYDGSPGVPLITENTDSVNNLQIHIKNFFATI